MERVISLVGLFAMVGVAWCMSSHRSKIRFRVVILGLSLQVLFAFLVLRTDPGRSFFDGVGALVNQFLGFVGEGSDFVFGINSSSEIDGLPHRKTLLQTFCFGVLPTIVFFASFMSILYWLGVMQWVVQGMAWVMQRTLGTSGAESLAAAANVFVGHTEAPLVVRPYLEGLTRSELNALMVGGFSTITGGLLAAYVGMGIDAGHLVTAAVISAPASLVIAKVLLPETEVPVTAHGAKVEIPRRGVNVIEAAAIGASDGLKLALNVGAMLLAFLALIAMVNAIFGWAGNLFDQTWTLQGLLGLVFAPMAWLIGIPWVDCEHAGELLGTKMVANEFIAYQQLGEWSQPDSEVHLQERSRALLTYALSGFSNFGAIAIQIGGIGGLAPSRSGDLSRLGLRAMIGGALACCMTACVVGLLL